MHRKIAYLCALTTLLSSISLNVLAQESQSDLSDQNSFNVRGFGTVGLTRTNTNDALYRANWQNSGGAGKHWDPSVDSKFGVQADWQINDAFALTAQSEVEKGASGSYEPDIEWLFASYWFTPDLAIRVGRTRLPTFTASDYYNIGNAYLWVRPPADVYNQLSFFSVDGIDFLYEYHTDKYSIFVQPVAGKSKFDLYFSVAGGRLQGNVDRIHGINTSLQVGEFSFRFGLMSGVLNLTNRSVELNALVDGLNQASVFFPAAAGMAERFGLVNRNAKFSSLGASYDGKDVIVLSELTKRTTESIMPDSTGWYVTGGLKHGVWTPYITYSEQRIDSPRHDDTIPAVGQFAQLSQSVNAVLGYPSNDRATALGLRFEYSPKIMVKTEVENIDGGIPPVPGHPQPSNVKVFSAVVDFIF